MRRLRCDDEVLVNVDGDALRHVYVVRDDAEPVAGRGARVAARGRAIRDDAVISLVSNEEVLLAIEAQADWLVELASAASRPAEAAQKVAVSVERVDAMTDGVGDVCAAVLVQRHVRRRRHLIVAGRSQLADADAAGDKVVLRDAPSPGVDDVQQPAATVVLDADRIGEHPVAKLERLRHLTVAETVGEDAISADAAVAGVSDDDGCRLFVGCRHPGGTEELASAVTTSAERHEARLAPGRVEDLDAVVVAFRHDDVARLGVDAFRIDGQRPTNARPGEAVEDERARDGSKDGEVWVTVDLPVEHRSGVVQVLVGGYASVVVGSVAGVDVVKTFLAVDESVQFRVDESMIVGGGSHFGLCE